MKHDVIIAGVARQGVQTVATIIAAAARRSFLFASQPHMPRRSQRDGAVAHIRISNSPLEEDAPIHRGQADTLIGIEPLETLGYSDYLRHDGSLLAATDPVRDIPNYPDIEIVLEMIRSLPRSSVVDAKWLAEEEGAPDLRNLVILGAAAHLLPIPVEELRQVVEETFADRPTAGRLFDAGRAAARNEHLVDEFAMI
jgi:indolepyruvate ferredoxin oxidoreductase, beta subunit